MLNDEVERVLGVIAQLNDEVKRVLEMIVSLEADIAQHKKLWNENPENRGFHESTLQHLWQEKAERTKRLETLETEKRTLETEKRTLETEKRTLETEKRTRLDAVHKAYHEGVKLPDSDLSFWLEARLDEMLNSYTSQQRRPTTPTRKDFLFMERDDQISFLSKAFIKNFDSFLSHSPYKKDRWFCSITGAPDKSWKNITSLNANLCDHTGLGKTRLAIETVRCVRQHIEANILEYRTTDSVDKLLEQLTSAVTCTVDLSDREALELLKDHVEAFIAIALINSYLFPSWPFMKVAQRLAPYAQLRVDIVVSCIQSRKQLSQQPLCMVMHVDEFQRLVPEEDRTAFSVNSNTRRELTLRKVAEDMMSLVTRFTSVFIMPMFTGTLPFQFLQIFPATAYQYLALQVHTLSVNSGIQILKNYNASWASRVEGEAFKRLLRALGVIPRALEYLVEVLDRKGVEIKNETLYSAIEEQFTSAYSLGTQSPDLFTRILQCVLDGTVVTPDTPLTPGTTVAALKAEGFIFESRRTDPREPSKFTLDMPYIYLTSANSQLEIFPKDFLSWGTIFHPYMSEIFPLQFEVFRQNLLFNQNKKTATLAELYRHATIDPELKDVEVELQHMQLFHAHQERFPRDVTEEGKLRVMNNDPIDLLNGSAAVWVGRNNTTTDGFTVRPLAKGGYNGFKRLLVLTQVKSTIPTAGYKSTPCEKKKAFFDEKNKAFGGAATVKLFNDCLVMFCYVINKHQQSLGEITDESSSSMQLTIVIHKENSTKYFSPVFAPFVQS